MTFNKVIDHLYVGDEWDAEYLRVTEPYKEFLIVDVRPYYWGNWGGFTIDPKRLLAGSKIVADFVKDGYDAYIHCAMGMERSPFFAALVLNHLHPERTLSGCYLEVCMARPQARFYKRWVRAMKGKEPYYDPPYTFMNAFS